MVGQRSNTGPRRVQMVHEGRARVQRESKRAQGRSKSFLNGPPLEKEKNSQARVRLNLLFRSDHMQCKDEEFMGTGIILWT